MSARCNRHSNSAYYPPLNNPPDWIVAIQGSRLAKGCVSQIQNCLEPNNIKLYKCCLSNVLLSNLAATVKFSAAVWMSRLGGNCRGNEVQSRWLSSERVFIRLISKNFHRREIGFKIIYQKFIIIKYQIYFNSICIHRFFESVQRMVSAHDFYLHLRELSFVTSRIYDRSPPWGIQLLCGIRIL